jgi:uncharacterized Ntn-hydrolase superfamily protein
MFGVAITTSSICVGARCPWALAGVGAVATQNVTLPSIGNHVLAALQTGLSAQAALDQVMATQSDTEYRQVAVIGKSGAPAIFSGSNTLGTHAVSAARNCIAAGNLLKSPDLPAAMTARFEAMPGNTHLAERLLSALETGLYDAGGEAGSVHSAALLVVDKQDWPLVDLRVDWDETDPVKTLRNLWRAYEPEMGDYVIRALNPGAAPSYGVPGDE